MSGMLGQELDTMFSKARAGSLDFKIIEQRIHDEKKEWYRDKVRNMGLHSATKSPSEAKLLQQKLDDREMPTEELASELRGAISDDALPEEAAFDNFLNRLKDAETTQARNDVYIDTLFQPSRDPEKAAMYQRYMEMIRGGVAVQYVVDVMLRDRRWAQSNEEQKQRLQGKLEELKRAKAAHELSLAKKQKARQDKAAAAAASDSQTFWLAHYATYWESSTGSEMDPFCIARRHVAKTTTNRIGKQRITALQAKPVWIYTTLTWKWTRPGGSPCFVENGVHVPERKKARVEVDDESQLEYASEDKAHYRARKIEEHLVTLGDAVEEYQQRTGATVS
ncbi:hypothetical protein DL770_009411 [Monosporascus sp. CRB-9-2]|nr:hypothetical protein DL770_009411 [Monosporascus sp. CRB-9-2]